jgi:hypothetical protein
MKRTLVLVLAALTVFATVAVAAEPKRGKYQGTVAAGYGGPQMAFVVKAGKVKDILARMFYSCNNGPQQQTIVAPSKAYRVSSKGRFSGKTTESIGGVASETVWIKGRFTSRTQVKGTIRSQTVGGGETCETQERKFSLNLKK